MDSSVARKLGLKSVPLPSCLRAISLDGALPWEKTHRTSSVIMQVNSTHSEEISFFECNSPDQPVILGYPWLCQHNPQIDWITGWLTFKPEICQSCVTGTESPTTLMGPVLLTGDSPDLSAICTCYHGLREVFSKAKATSLPSPSWNYAPHEKTLFLDAKLRQWRITFSLP